MGLRQGLEKWKRVSGNNKYMSEWSYFLYSVKPQGNILGSAESCNGYPADKSLCYHLSFQTNVANRTLSTVYQQRKWISEICASYKKSTHYTPCRQKGKRRYTSTSFLISTLDGLSGQRHAPAALYPLRKYPLYQEAGWPEIQCGRRVWRKIVSFCRDRTIVI
jgi:hypothetical protein